MPETHADRIPDDPAPTIFLVLNGTDRSEFYSWSLSRDHAMYQARGVAEQGKAVTVAEVEIPVELITDWLKTSGEATLLGDVFTDPQIHAHWEPDWECDDDELAGVHWPVECDCMAAPDGYTGVERCDTCRLYDTDWDAAVSLLQQLGFYDDQPSLYSLDTGDLIPGATREMYLDTARVGVCINHVPGVSRALVLPDGTRYDGRYQLDGNGMPKVDIASCGHCLFEWNDALMTSLTPAPAARCPNEYGHVYDD